MFHLAYGLNTLSGLIYHHIKNCLNNTYCQKILKFTAGGLSESNKEDYALANSDCVQPTTRKDCLAKNIYGQSFENISLDAVKNIYQNLFQESGGIRIEYLTATLHRSKFKTEDILATKDVDHYNLLEKAIIYDDIDVVTLLLSKVTYYEFASEPHLACLLGSLKILTQLGKLNMQWLNRREYVRIQSVMGPTVRNKLKLLGYQSPKRPLHDDVITRKIKYMALNKILPIEAAVIGDNTDVMTALLSLHSENKCENSNDDLKVLMHDLIQLACKFECYNSLGYLLQKPMFKEMDIKDQIESLSVGFSHGVAFLKFLLESGVDFIKARSQCNLFHLYFLSLENDDQIVKPHLRITETLQWIEKCGISPNSQCCMKHNVSMTALHHVLRFLNQPLGVSSNATFVDEEMGKIQCQFDKSIYSAIQHLANQVNVDSVIDTLLIVLFHNQHFSKRYFLRNRYLYLNQNAFGLLNVLSSTKFLLDQCTISRTKGKNKHHTPLTALIEQLSHPSAFYCVMHDRNCFKTFHSCLVLLLQNGYDPNSSSREASPSCLIHFLDIVSTHWAMDLDMPTDYFAQFHSFIEALIQHGAEFRCHIVENGCILESCVLDFTNSIYSSLPSASVVTLIHNVPLLHGLVSQLLLAGTDCRVYEYISGKNTTNNPESQYLIYRTMVLIIETAKRLSKWGFNHEETSKLDNIFSQYVFMLYMFTEEPFASRSLQMCTEIDELECIFPVLHGSVLYWGSNVKTMKLFCKLSLHKHFGRQYNNAVPLLPVPVALKTYLASVTEKI